ITWGAIEQILLFLVSVFVFSCLISIFIRRRSVLRAYISLAVLAGSALTLGFGIAGYCLRLPESPSAGLVPIVVGAVYYAAQNFFLNAAPERGADHPFLALSQLFGLATVVLVAVEALQRLFANSIQRVVLARRRGHTVVYGLGEIGSHLIEDLAEQRRSESKRPWGMFEGPVVVEIDRENDLIDKVRDHGVPIVFGDATDERLLKQVSADRASEIFFVTGSDEANFEGVSDLLHLLARPHGTEQDGSRAGDPIRIYLHLRYPEVGRVLEVAAESPTIPRARPVIVRSFNVFDQAAQDVLVEDVLPRRPRESDEVAHFVIVGFGTMAKVLALHLAELAHFENCRRTRMTIVTAPRDREKVERFKILHPRLFPEQAGLDPWMPDEAMDHWSYGVRLKDVHRPGEDPEDRGIDFVCNGGWIEHRGAPRADDFIDRIVTLAGASRVRPFVFICKETDEENAALAQELRAELNERLQKAEAGRLSVLAYVPERPKLTRLIRDLRVEDLLSFGASEEVCSHEALTLPLQRQLAEAIARYYFEKYGGESSRFTELKLWARRSNLSAAAHLNIKLAALGKRIVLRREGGGADPLGEVPESKRETIARMEHNRWLAERLLTGWTFGPRDDTRKKRPALVDWSHLSESEAKKDRDQVQAVLQFCSSRGELALRSLEDGAADRSGRNAASGR
ncbi:MAG: hypothetical protein GF346_02380, partial [Candidatus Eisenbacteria bacterium]|nr:hypothetical protein [Candidatus Latescibacterota bacterium]MBD3301275.1 hypothetical protein [Candidatus Eisenbacteria bacterium]